MNLTSKKASLIILGITALACSRTWFVFIDDPEGPNLLIVTVLAAILFFVSLLVLRFIPSLIGLRRLLIGILTQILLVTILYFFLG